MSVDLPTVFDNLTTSTNYKTVSGGMSFNMAVNRGLLATESACNGTCTADTNGQLQMYTNGGSTRDFSGCVFVLGLRFYNPLNFGIDTEANSAVTLTLYDSDDDYKAWTLGGKDTDLGRHLSYHCIVIDPLATADWSSGTLGVSSMEYYGIGLDTLGTNNRIYINRAVLVSKSQNDSEIPKIYSTGSDWEEYYDNVAGTSYSTVLHTYIDRLSDVFLLNTPMQIGKSSTKTTFNDNGVTVVSPSSDSEDPVAKTTNTSFPLYITVGRSDSTFTLSGTYEWGTRSTFDFDDYIAGATITLDDTIFRGMGDIELGKNVTGTATFEDTGIVDKDKDASINGSVFRDPYSNTLLEITGGTCECTDLSFYGYTSNYAVILASAGTYTFSNCTFDASGTHEFYADLAGNVTINCYNCNACGLGVCDAISGTNSGVGSLTVNHYVDVTVNNIISGSALRLEYQTSGAEIYSNSDVGTSVTFEYSYVGNTDVYIKTRKAGNLPYKGEGTITDLGMTHTVNMEDDSNYDVET